MTRALLVAASVYDGRRGTSQSSVEDAHELSQLASAAGLDGLAIKTMRVRAAHPATFFGAGGVDALCALAAEVRADMIVVNRDLTAMQSRNLEVAVGRAVLDRSGLILDIFARRARTHESKTQVELARSQRHLSRLAGLWSHLERQRGGIGVRGGPGEKQIELDRRQTGEKIRRLRLRIDRLQSRGDSARKRRRKNGVLSAAIVGYTNAGKSTLFNSLTRAAAPANDRMFDTLELKSRRMYLDGGTSSSSANGGGFGDNNNDNDNVNMAAADNINAVISDTVGFIRELPHELVSGFAATLRDSADSDLLLIVADAASGEWRRQLSVVMATLAQIGAAQVPHLLVMNKSDRVANAAAVMDDYDTNGGYGDGDADIDIASAVWISAKTGAGMDNLRRRLRDCLGRIRRGGFAGQK
ncbi:MAG: GTPase HflX [Gammaproteobacteria bacterium]